jgi:hypothetical protein
MIAGKRARQEIFSTHPVEHDAVPSPFPTEIRLVNVRQDTEPLADEWRDPTNYESSGEKHMQKKFEP